MQFTAAKILSTAVPSIAMHLTEGLSCVVSCMSHKEDKRSDLLPVRSMSSFDRDGGTVWLSWLKNSSRLPSRTWKARVVKTVDNSSSALQPVIDVLYLFLFSRR